MPHEQLMIRARPRLNHPRLVMGFTGWMDGGEVSTRAVETLVRALPTELLADIAPDPFYIYSFPGTMEVSALFRPHVKIEDGLITELKGPWHVFLSDTEHTLILVRGPGGGGRGPVAPLPTTTGGLSKSSATDSSV